MFKIILWLSVVFTNDFMFLLIIEEHIFCDGISHFDTVIKTGE